MEVELLQSAMSTGADGVTILIGLVLLRHDRRLYNLELFTGFKKLIQRK